MEGGAAGGGGGHPVMGSSEMAAAAEAASKVWQQGRSQRPAQEQQQQQQQRQIYPDPRAGMVPAQAQAAPAGELAVRGGYGGGGGAGDGKAAAQWPPNSAAATERQRVIQQKLAETWTEQWKEMQATTDFRRGHILPLARIKKIMKTDEDVRMISAEAPVIFGKACEMMIIELTMRAWQHTEENKRRTLQVRAVTPNRYARPSPASHLRRAESVGAAHSARISAP